MQQTRKTNSRSAAGMTAPTYRINRPRRHSAIRRYVGYGIIR
jgi:hypothetical protein